jgi:hypothetical protein
LALREEDYFSRLGVSVDYDSLDLCEAIGVAAPGNVVFEGRALLGLSVAKTIQLLSSLGPPDVVESGCWIWRKSGLSLWSESGEEDEPVLEVGIFRQGYYEQYDLPLPVKE